MNDGMALGSSTAPPISIAFARPEIAALGAPAARAVTGFGAPVVRGNGSAKDEGRDSPVSRAESRPSESGRQDLNLRPLVPKHGSRSWHRFAGGRAASQPLRSRRRASLAAGPMDALAVPSEISFGAPVVRAASSRPVAYYAGPRPKDVAHPSNSVGRLARSLGRIAPGVTCVPPRSRRRQRQSRGGDRPGESPGSVAVDDPRRSAPRCE